jgi:hypothetical protein
LIVTQLIEKLPNVMEQESSLPSSQQLASGLHPEPDEPSPNPYNLFLLVAF